MDPNDSRDPFTPPSHGGVPKPAATRYDDGAGGLIPPEPRLITLEAWIEHTYGSAVSIATARRWCRECRITPAPQKHGRAYFVAPDARYIDLSKTRPRLVEALRAADAA
jgi:hypothetical protein